MTKVRIEQNISKETEDMSTLVSKKVEPTVVNTTKRCTRKKEVVKVKEDEDEEKKDDLLFAFPDNYYLTKSASLVDPNVRARWGRNHDKVLFKTIQKYEQQGRLRLKTILELSVENDDLELPELMDLASSLKWTGPMKNLVHRIQFICSHPEMSVRESKL